MARAITAKDPSHRPNPSHRASPNHRVNPSPQANPRLPASRSRRPKRPLPVPRNPTASKMRGLAVFAAILIAPVLRAGDVPVPGLRKPVEILRDRWGVPHIYAQTVEDLFFAQGYITAKDRLFQIDLWRRIGTGKLAEALGPAAIERDRLSRAVRWRGPMEHEWRSYGPDTQRIATSFTSGIN